MPHTPEELDNARAWAQFANTLQPYICLDPAVPVPPPTVPTDAELEEILTLADTLLEQWGLIHPPPPPEA
jgi:hypothetical protein